LAAAARPLRDAAATVPTQALMPTIPLRMRPPAMRSLKSGPCPQGNRGRAEADRWSHHEAITRARRVAVAHADAVLDVRVLLSLKSLCRASA
jgi:hypothetical protein